MAKTQAVGIDLGTTLSAAAYLAAPGQTTMIRNAEGDLLTPSVVLFEDDKVVVGRAAKDQASAYPDRVAERVKRDMGKEHYSRAIRGKRFPPEVIASYILGKIKEDIAETIGDNFKVVITVPAYFNDARRKATADAGEIAGLDVLGVVNEPTAAALAFGEHLGYLGTRGSPREEMNVLVYDLGGGTFDVSLLHLEMDDVRTLATDGDMDLGGTDWDERLVEHIVELFISKYGMDPRSHESTRIELLRAAEQAKKELSVRKKTTLSIRFGGRSLKLRVTREQFEELTAYLLERTAVTTKQVLEEAGLDFDAVSRILLVGGSTRMPMVMDMLEELSGITPDHVVNPDEAVARGAAIYAGYLLSFKEAKAHGYGYRITDVNSHSLGLEGLDPTTQRRRTAILVPRNSPLPIERSRRFATKSAGQKSAVIKVLEGESDSPEECAIIGRTVMRELPGDLPAGHPVDVTFAYDTNGRLTVKAHVADTDRRVEIDFQREAGLSPARLDHWRKVVAGNGKVANFEELLDDVIGSIE